MNIATIEISKLKVQLRCNLDSNVQAIFLPRLDEVLLRIVGKYIFCEVIILGNGEDITLKRGNPFPIQQILSLGQPIENNRITIAQVNDILEPLQNQLIVSMYTIKKRRKYSDKCQILET